MALLSQEGDASEKNPDNLTHHAPSAKTPTTSANCSLPGNHVRAGELYRGLYACQRCDERVVGTIPVPRESIPA